MSRGALVTDLVTDIGARHRDNATASFNSHECAHAQVVTRSQVRRCRRNYIRAESSAHNHRSASDRWLWTTTGTVCREASGTTSEPVGAVVL